MVTGWTIVLTWSIVAILHVGRNLVAVAAQPGAIPWDRAALFELIYWYLWAAVTPIVLACVERLPIRGPSQLRNIVALSGIGLMLAAGQSLGESVISLTIGRVLFHLSAADAAAHWRIIESRFPIEWLAGFTINLIIVGAADAVGAWSDADRLSHGQARLSHSD